MCGIVINTAVIVYIGHNASRQSVTRAGINTGRSALLRQLRENGTGCATQIVLGEERERNAVWRCKRGKIRSEKEWQRCRMPPGVNGAFRCLIINSRTELNATPILLCSRTTSSLSRSLVLLFPYRGNLKIPWPEETRDGGGEEGYTFN